MSFLDELINEYVHPGSKGPGHNFQTTSIVNGRIVCHDLAATDDSAVRQVQKRCIGIKYPDTANIFARAGVLQTGHGGPCRTLTSGIVARSGLARAWVYVPASTVVADGQLVSGTLLNIASEWVDATDLPKFGRVIGSDVYYGILEPLIAPQDACAATTEGTYTVMDPPAPAAMLLEALTPAAAATVQLAWVSLFPPRLVPRTVTKHLSVIDGTDKVYHLCATSGPGMITRVTAQVIDSGGTSGGTEIDILICPRGEYDGAAENKSVFEASETILIPHDMSTTHVPVYGVGGTILGDTDPDNDDSGVDYGTSARNGLLVERAERMFPAGCGIAADIAENSGDGAPLDLSLTVEMVMFG